MIKSMDNLLQFIDKVLPLISTLLGAYITYFVTVSSKKNELKVNVKTKARDEWDIWVKWTEKEKKNVIKRAVKEGAQ